MGILFALASSVPLNKVLQNKDIYCISLIA